MSRGGLVVLVALLALLAGACSSSEGGRSAEGPVDGSAPSTAVAPVEPPVVRATAVPVPARNVCHQMTWDQALAPTDETPVVDCAGAHTTETFSVGQLRTSLDGHLLAVDSTRVQAQVARQCPQRLAALTGGSRSDLRLSMLRAIWFTPTVAESDQGANWLRCDVTALATDGELASVTGSLKGALARPAGRERYAMCASAAPGAGDFERVVCKAPHRWRAVQVVDLGRGDYPGKRRVRAAGQEECKDAGRERATDALDFRWGYEWPTADQWAAGQTYGRCWAPDAG